MGANAAHDHAIDKERTTSIDQPSGESWHELTETEVGEAARHVGRRLMNGELLKQAHTREDAERAMTSVARQYLRTTNQLNRINVESVVEALKNALDVSPDSGSLALSAIETVRGIHTDEASVQLDQTLTGFNQTPELFDRIQALRIALDANNSTYVAHTLKEAYAHRGERMTSSELDAAIGLYLRKDHAQEDLRFIHASLQDHPEVWQWFTETVIPNVDHAMQDRQHWNAITPDMGSQNEFTRIGRFLSFLGIDAAQITINAQMNAEEGAHHQGSHSHRRHHGT